MDKDETARRNSEKRVWEEFRTWYTQFGESDPVIAERRLGELLSRGNYFALEGLDKHRRSLPSLRGTLSRDGLGGYQEVEIYGGGMTSDYSGLHKKQE